MNTPVPDVPAVPPTPAPASRAGHGARIVMSLVLLALLVALGWRGWTWWQAREAARHAAPQPEPWQALDARVDALRRDQRAQAQRMAQAEAGARILREEVLGVGQRAALLQDSIDQLAGPAREGAKALRLDEVELLLSQGAQRLHLAGDLEGAQQAYALAAGLLDGLQDPALLDVRQSLAQEQAALAALGADPRASALARLDAHAARLAPPDTAPRAATAGPGASQPWWQRVASRLVQVQPSDRTLAASPGERAAGYAALQLEFTLARSAAERRDEAAWRAALQRAGRWQARLWPKSAATQRLRAELEQLQALPLRIELPGFGSTLSQLQDLRRTP